MSNKRWFTTSSGRIEIEMTTEQAASVSHSGQCDDDVLALSQVPEIKKQVDAIDKDLLAKELDEYGAWDETELSDHEQNIQRIVWIAGCDIDEREYE